MTICIMHLYIINIINTIMSGFTIIILLLLMHYYGHHYLSLSFMHCAFIIIDVWFVYY